MSDIKTHVITGKVAWASVIRPVNKYKSEDLEYRVSVEVDMDTIDLLNSLGSQKKYKKLIDKKTGDEVLPGRFMTFSRPAGDNVAPLLVVDKEGNKVDQLVGNGSTAKVSIALIPYNSPEFGSGVKAQLTAVQVLDLVPYQSNKTNSTAVADAAGIAALGLSTNDEDLI